ncbi:MAG: hypothetical protein P8P83_04330 [Rickettsiaceae bacterium]|nr:hypothetical protein [Rickettsiaceae bacterium]
MSNTEEELDKNKLAEAKKNLESFFSDINTAKKSDFEEQESEKTEGVSAGSIATKTKSGNKSVLKVVYKSNDEIAKELEAVQENIKTLKALEQSKKATQKDLTDLKNYKNQELELQQKSTDRDDFVREQVSSRFYKLLLHDDAHTVQLVTQEQDDKLYLSGKFFDDVELLTKFSGSDDPGLVNSTTKLQKLKGVEKIFAACHIMGETDYHSDNLMVDSQNNLKKIDHGKSLLRDAKDFSSVVTTIYTDFFFIR